MFRVLDFAGKGGMWNYARLMATGLHLAGSPVSLHTAFDAEADEPTDIGMRVVREHYWPSEASRTELLKAHMHVERSWHERSMSTRDVVIVGPQLFGLVRSPWTIHMQHDPQARPILGSRVIPQVQMALHRVLHTGYRARHGPKFGSDGMRMLTWPHPCGPASFQAERIDLEALWPHMPVATEASRLLVFGRAAEPHNLARLHGWITESDLTSKDLVVHVAHPSINFTAETWGAGVPVMGYRGRIPNKWLDSLMSRVDAVSIPYETSLASASGIMALAAYWGVDIVASAGVRHDLYTISPRVAGIGSAGLREIATRRQQRVGVEASSRASTQVSLSAWGANAATLIRLCGPERD